MNTYEAMLYDLNEGELARAEVTYLETRPRHGGGEGRAFGLPETESPQNPTGLISIRRRSYGGGGFYCRLETSCGVRFDDVLASDLIEYERLGWEVLDPHGYWGPLPFDGSGTPPAPELDEDEEDYGNTDGYDGQTV